MEERKIDVTIKFRKNKIAHAGDALLIIIPKAFKQDFLEIGVNRP